MTGVIVHSWYDCLPARLQENAPVMTEPRKAISTVRDLNKQPQCWENVGLSCQCPNNNWIAVANKVQSIGDRRTAFLIERISVSQKNLVSICIQRSFDTGCKKGGEFLTL